MKTRILLLGVWILVCMSCENDDEYSPISTQLDVELTTTLEEISQGQGKSFFILPLETDYTNIPQDPLNPITREKVALGQLLVHETATGGNPKMPNNIYTYACASCHPVASGFSPGIHQGIGEGGVGFGIAGEARIPMDSGSMPRDSIDVQPVKPPTLLNVAYQEVALWNGALGGSGINLPYVDQNAEEIPENLLGYQGLEVQGMAGQEAHRLKIDTEFAETFGYKDLFDAAFPDVPVTERYSKLTGALAIAAFNRTILTNRAPWQQWLKGDKDAMTRTQKRGALVFFGKGRCFECHTGPALKSNEFHSWGFSDFDPNVAIILEDRRSFGLPTLKGRGDFTANPKDDYKFKVPTLYNLKMNPFYGHGSSFNNLRDLVEYKNNGAKQNEIVPDGQLASQFGTTNLTEGEISQLVDFLEHALYDAEINRYVPESVFSGNCIPNNDPQSRFDLGCD